MPLLEWTSQLSVGVKQFDDQHKQLVALLNELYDAMKQGKANEALEKVLARVLAYTRTHFSAEESLMQKHGYSKLAEHRAEHQALVTKVVDLEAKMKAKAAFLSVEVMDFLKSWLTNHIQKTDKQYEVFFNVKGVK